MTQEEWKEARKGVKRYMSKTGWALLVYYFVLNASVLGFVFAQVIFRLARGVVQGNESAIEHAVMLSMENAWGYFIAAAIGMLLLLIWKKTRYLKEKIFAKGAPMNAGSFFTILCIFISGQMIFQIGTTVMELILNLFGYTISEGLESLETDPANFSMFLYAGILAPVAEEILFRGLVQRMMLPFGKKFAILVSSLTFGLFHGNLLQAPYAFAVGLVLGYVAAEYNILWAMLLHLINNLVLGDLLYRVLGGLPEETVGMIVWGVILAFTVAAVILMILRRKEIASYLRSERIVRPYVRCYFSCAGTITMLIILGLNTLTTTFAMITPL